MFSSLLKFPLTDPVLIFSVILFIILLAPIILHRFKIPDLIGLILAGALIGPNGLSIMARDSSIELFGKVGLLYIMFIAGLEIDLADLKKNYSRGGIFRLAHLSDSYGYGDGCRSVFVTIVLAQLGVIGQYVCLPHPDDLSDCE